MALIFWLLGALTALIVGSVLRVRRAHVEAAMRRAGVADPARVAREMYSSLGVGLGELCHMALSPRRALACSVELPPQALALVEARRGFVIATAHTGNWDLVACALGERAPLTVATKRLSMRFLDRLWQGARAKRGLRLVQVGEVARAARAALGRGEPVAMMIDQAPERARGAIRAEFLGAPAWIDLAPALIAARSRVPLVVAFPLRRADGTHTVELAGVIDPPRGRREVERAMRRASGWLEAFVLRHPEQWLWLHRRWKDAPKACRKPVRVAPERAFESP
jgi:Kdo2-lipid IVA lauroyltransferase/acyltransferase